MTYAEAVRRIVADYNRRKSEFEQRERELLERDAQFFASETELRDSVLRKIKGEQISDAQLAEMTEKNQAIRARLQLIPPLPRCKKCNDTGRAHGKFCDCAVALALRSQADDVGIALHDFTAVDYTVYGSAAEQYKKLFGQVEKICSLYPAAKKRCMVIGGGTGNGKTYLAGCAAHKILQRGMSVTALTAFAANNRFLKYHTCFDDGKAAMLDALLDCTLLVLDDLGTESILKNVTVEYLYQVINERNASGKLTLITTNLTPDKLLNRYGERIYSRLFDKSLSFAVYLTAPDLRKAF